MIDAPSQTFFDLLANWNDTQSIGNEDLLAAVLPLMQQVAEMHEAGKVAPLVPADRLPADHGHLFFAQSDAQNIHQVRAVKHRQDRTGKSGVKIVSELRVTSDDAVGTDVSDERVAEDASLEPRYLTDYRSWEIEAGHHDPITDIYLLGMLIASLATGLDFRQKDQLETFTRHRNDLARLNNRLSPVICRAIERMTELERYNRAQDVPTLIRAFENHRMIGSVFENDLSTSAAFGVDEEMPKGQLLKRLRARLYDMTRRNRLIYYRPVSAELNLTETSVPLVVNLDAIKPDHLFTAQTNAMDQLIAGKEVALRDYIRFEEMQFAPSVLAKLRSESARVAREYGAAPLRLVPVFLRWHDLKNDPHTPISSPLLLVRAELKRRKGVKDVFTLQLLDTVAEVNPALSFALEKLYGMKLPTTVDLTKKEALTDLHKLIENQILTSEPGVRLEYSDKPRIQILHQKVRRRLDQFNKRRLGAVRTRRARAGMSYSYDHPGFNPLGLQLFREYVCPAQAPNQAVLGRALPRMFNSPQNMVEAAMTEKEATTFTQKQGTDGRFNWSFDLCSVTLANFNYRKMSLVRDYDAMLNGDLPPNETFDLLFEEKSYENSGIPAVPKAENRYPVIAMDPSQEKSVLRARHGESYVIQGPPGTGKSQTITNLIADFIGQGKRVLFVCEKRAALDVVFNRLNGIGLGTLCSLVHDSQQNKREFIQELDEIYTRWTSAPRQTTMAELEQERQKGIQRIEAAVDDIRFHLRTMEATAEGSDQALHAVIERAIEAPAPDLNADDASLLPSLDDWIAYEDQIDRVLDGIKRVASGESFSNRPERLLASSLWADESKLQTVPDLARGLVSRAARLTDASAHLFGDDTMSVGDAFAQIKLAARVAPMAEVGQLALLDPDSRESRQFAGDQRQLDDKQRLWDEAVEKASAWIDKLSPEETQTALRLAEAKEGKLFSFLSGEWRRLKATVAARTNTANAAVQPTIIDLLTTLSAEHEAASAYRDTAKQVAMKFGFDNFEELFQLVKERASGRMAEGVATDQILAAIRDDPNTAEKQVLKLAAFGAVVEGVDTDAQGQIEGLDSLAFGDLHQTLQSLETAGAGLQDLKFLLAPLAEAPASLWRALRNLNLAHEEWNAAILNETVRRSLIKTPGLTAVGHDMLSKTRQKIAEAKEGLHDINAKLLELRTIEQFDKHIALTGEMDRNLSMEDRALKSNYSKARRALEHEFKKTRAYRSPREMLDGPAGALIPDMKPIWLMSPLSVADVLPLESNLFDVVIFDEASQIPVEDAIPTLLRAPQVIVVGDEMQLPPSNFFGSNDAGEDFDETEEDADFELNQDSFLTLAAERLKSTMLRWHYRSRSEELIGFSNQAFYGGDLLTIPSTRNLTASPEIKVSDTEAPPLSAAQVLERPISYHMIENGVYALRRNTQEAQYIAHLLRDLLALENGKTIGIVAFSEAQQSEIESALSQLAAKDPDFSKRLDAEFDREEDGEFIGLFVKNLENVQGDERDIILLSICYAPAANGKMRMNFGPINKMGGEKRLNVIFSRSKENMIVVSSITSDQITNDYNHGANALKTFLRFAQLTSVGDHSGAAIAIKSIGAAKARQAQSPSIVAQELAETLRSSGYEVAINLGLSQFSIDVAIKRPNESDFYLAILIDTPESYQKNDTLETFTDRANLLELFGWNVLCLTTREWFKDANSMIETVKQRLN